MVNVMAELTAQQLVLNAALIVVTMLAASVAFHVTPGRRSASKGQ